MVSVCITWYGATKPLFVNNKVLKVNTKDTKDTRFIQDSAPSHRANLVQDFLSEKLNKRFVKYSEWPPTSPDCNPLDYYFWEKLQRKVYENRFNRTFENENALKRRIRRVWPEVSRDIEEIRKALKEFVPRLKSVIWLGRKTFFMYLSLLWLRMVSAFIILIFSLSLKIFCLC